MLAPSPRWPQIRSRQWSFRQERPGDTPREGPLSPEECLPQRAAGDTWLDRLPSDRRIPRSSYEGPRRPRAPGRAGSRYEEPTRPLLRDACIIVSHTSFENSTSLARYAMSGLLIVSNVCHDRNHKSIHAARGLIRRGVQSALVVIACLRGQGIGESGSPRSGLSTWIRPAPPSRLLPTRQGQRVFREKTSEGGRSHHGSPH